MKKDIFKVYRSKEIGGKIFGGLFLMVFGCIFFLCYIRYNPIKDISMFSKVQEAKQITAGEDLSKYYRQKVRCTVKYALYNVMTYSEKVLFLEEETCAWGYIVVDENMVNPFCVMVGGQKASAMEKLCENTGYLLSDNAKYDENMSFSVEGYVKKLNREAKGYYYEALKEIYGAEYIDDTVAVYYIDEDDVTLGMSGVTNNLKGRVSCLIGIIACIVFMIRSIKNTSNEVLTKFIEKKGITKEILNDEFSRAKEVVKGCYISPKYTFFVLDSKSAVVDNDEIVWVYKDLVKQKNVDKYFLRIWTVSKERKTISVYAEDKIDILLKYYQNEFPHIAVGMDNTKAYLFKNDFDAFLALNYTREKGYNMPENVQKM